MTGSAGHSGTTVIRLAVAEDVAALEALIARSARELSQGFYTDEETEAAIAHVFGVDGDLVADGTYFVAEENGRPLACGGWSRRQTLFGGDRYARRDPSLLDPRVDAARIRAFFVDPTAARRGLASALLRACENAAGGAGFATTALMATRPGVPFYAARGYVAERSVSLDLGGTAVTFVPMNKTLVQK